MSALLALVVPFLFYWLILFVACFAVVEFGQGYLYDETTPSAALKVAGGSAILAAMLTWTRTEFQTMFTGDLGQTVILAVVSFAVFTLAFRFQPWHALPIGVLTVLLVSGTATMGVQSFTNRNRPLESAVRPQAKPLRRTTPIQTKTPLPEPEKAVDKTPKKK
jgi:hypothetical protein